MSSGKFHSKAKKPNPNLGDHEIAKCSHQIGGKYIHYKPRRANEGKEIVLVNNGDGKRELIVPNREPTESPGIWPLSEFERIKQQARVITLKEQMEMKEEASKKKAQLAEESDKRKQALQKAQLEQKAKQGSKLSEIESEAAKMKSYVLQRAFELRQEQEDEVKKANSLILASKCLAIREAQIMEHELMKKEMAEEEKRLDFMMEQQRQWGIKKEEEKQHLREIGNQKYVKQVSQQIRENEIQRLIEAERKEEEARNINRALIRMQRDDAEKIRQKHELQRRMGEELNKANADMEQYKIIQKEEQRIAEMRVLIFMQKKAEREAAREAELEEIKAAKEREVARLRAAQEKAQDSQAAADELNALRIQEEVEKKWRDAEKAAALKRKQQAEDMRNGRARQLEDIRKAQALEIEKDEIEFHRVAKVQNEMFMSEHAEKKAKKDAAIRHRMELLKQIDEKEKGRIISLREKFEEGTAVKLEAEVRMLQINETLTKKLQRLRENKVPENLIHDIEGKLHLTECTPHDTESKEHLPDQCTPQK